MTYQTMILELMMQRPRTLKELRSNRVLFPAIELYAKQLRQIHQSWKRHLFQNSLECCEEQIASEALEFALMEVQELFPTEPSDEVGIPFSLASLMAFLRAQTPTA